MAKSTEPKDYSKQLIRIAVNRAELYAEYPKLYRIFDYIDMIVSDEVPTMGVCPLYDTTGELTGKFDLYWNPDFVDKLTDKNLKGVLLHEALHIILDHTTVRMPELKSKLIINGNMVIKEDEDKVKSMTWNIAGDLAINQLLRELLQDPDSKWHGGLFPENKDLKAKDGSTLRPNQTAEYYYNEILQQKMQEYKDAKSLGEALEKLFKELGIGSHGEWVEANKDGQVTKGNAHGQVKDNKKKEDGSGDEASDEESKNKAKGDKKKIAEITGLDVFINSPAGNSKATSSTIDLKVGKQKKTPGWMKQTKHASVHGFSILPLLTRKVPNRRYGMSFPGKRRQQVGHVVLVAVDVSGSIDRPLYDDFCAHLNNLQRYSKFDIVFFNSSLLDADGNCYSAANAEKAPRPFKRGMTCHIGGGTDFDPVISLYNKVRNKYDALFVFTDGEASYSTKPLRSKEVNWIVYSGNIEYVKGNMPDGNIHPMSRGEYAESKE
jgi:predicted metal-dependent peptidase